MKKLLLVVLAFVGITSTAWAVAKEYRAADGFLCAAVDEHFSFEDRSKLIQELHGDPYSYAAIYFDTGSATAHDGCADIYKKIVDDLKAKANDVEQLVFIGSADKQGRENNYDNVTLARNRAEYAIKLFGGDESLFSLQEYVAGDADAEAFDSPDDNPESRVAKIFVLWKLPMCQEQEIQSIRKMKEDLANYKGPANVGPINQAIAKLEGFCKKAGDVLTASEDNEYRSYYAMLGQLLVQALKVDPELPVDHEEVERISVSGAYSNLKERIGSLGLTTSKWRNREGKFNTARLASDSIAGVVLGTAGGLITSHLVKKNQVKKGFEDIQCTIGGQKVAEWGDEFTVGIR